MSLTPRERYVLNLGSDGTLNTGLCTPADSPRVLLPLDLTARHGLTPTSSAYGRGFARYETLGRWLCEQGFVAAKASVSALTCMFWPRCSCLNARHATSCCHPL